MSTPHITIHAIMQAATRIIEASGRVVDPAESSTIKNRLIPYIARHEAPDLAFLVKHVFSGMLSSGEAQELIADAMPAPPKEVPLGASASDALLTYIERNDFLVEASGALTPAEAHELIDEVSGPRAEMIPLSTQADDQALAKQGQNSAYTRIQNGAQEVPKNLSNATCPTVPKMLEQGKTLTSPLVEQVTTSWADLARGANSAQDLSEPIASRGEAKHGAPSGSRLDRVAEAPPVELENEVEVPPEVEEERPAGGRFEGAGEGSEISPEAEDRGSVPAPRNLHFANLQLFHNQDFIKEKQAEWTLKLRWMTRAEPGVTHEHFIGFRVSPRKAREAVRRHAVEGKVSHAWADEFIQVTATLDKQLRVGPLSKRTYGNRKAAANASSNSREVMERCWGTLRLNSTNSAPQAITLYLVGDEPLVLTKFASATSKKKNAAEWIALFDPEGLHASKRQLATLRKHVADGRSLDEHSPNTAVGALIAIQVLPLMEVIARVSLDNANLLDRIEQQAELIAKLADDILDLKRAKHEPPPP